jgi:putative peptide zinc metalloprotease protein
MTHPPFPGAIQDENSTAEDRPVRLRKRADLILQPSAYQQENCWIVKDPISLKYFRLLEPETEVLRKLDGRTTYRQLKRHLEQKFPERNTRYEDLQNLLSSFHRSGLVTADSAGQAEPLLARARKTRNQKLTQLATSIL